MARDDDNRLWFVKRRHISPDTVTNLLLIAIMVMGGILTFAVLLLLSMWAGGVGGDL
jgi:hypothetical protein